MSLSAYGCVECVYVWMHVCVCRHEHDQHNEYEIIKNAMSMFVFVSMWVPEYLWMHVCVCQHEHDQHNENVVMKQSKMKKMINSCSWDNQSKSESLNGYDEWKVV